ncbi:MAG: SDR family oxidoreductase [Bacteroidetes bacterium]|nr:SDR family oxidoreductase [Bacteroidota bacterium]
MKAAIIGCNGYLGKHLCAFLMKKEWFIFGYDTAQNPLISISKYKSIDITQKDQLNKIDLNLDYLFYFSGITGTFNAYDKYENYIDINEKGLLHLLDLIRHSKSEIRIIFPSTRLVYKGVLDKELDENAEKEFKTIYALNKWFGEQVIQQYSNYFNLKYNIFRICVPYGNRFTKEYSYGTVGFFLNKAKSNESIVIYGDGDQKRTFTHVDDICTQIYYSIKKSESVNRIFNIAGETFSLNEVAQKIAAKYHINIEHKKWPEIDKKLESGDTVFNSNQIQELINKPLQNLFKSWLNKS